MSSTMSSETLPAPRRRRYGWWIAGGIVASLLALVIGTLVYFAEPIKFVAGWITGNPYVPGCQTTVVSEATVGPLWNRIVLLTCPNQTQHFVFVKRSGVPIRMPAFQSIDGPVPVSVRQTGDNEFEIVLAAPLADGRTSVPIKLGPDGMITEMQQFDHDRGRVVKLDNGRAE
jgi:hypothetical protein